MLHVDDLRKVRWHRRDASQSYDGYLVVTETFVRLLGKEKPTGIDAALTIPHTAIRSVAQAGGETVMLDVADGIPIVVEARGSTAAGALARRVAAASAAAAASR